MSNKEEAGWAWVDVWIPEDIERLLREGKIVQTGWASPYGVVPGGMDVDPAPGWLPVYRKVEA